MELLFLFLPVFLWIFIFELIVSVGRSRRGRMSGRSAKSAQRGREPRQFSRPKVQEGLFEMKVGNKAEKTADLGEYSPKGRKKDFVSGYDKKYAFDRHSKRRAAEKQYSHTYDGHEPWDKCLPKEKDPWDKDFYA